MAAPIEPALTNPALISDRDTERTRLLRDAVALGQAALSAGDKAEASRWLDRAHRIAPGDATITLLLASATIGVDNARAAALFSEVLASDDVWDAWLGLATARFLAADLSAARGALDGALGRHASRPNAAGLADRVAWATGAPGWCRLTSDGVVVVHSIGQQHVEARLDGTPVGSGNIHRALPRHSPARPDDKGGVEFPLPPSWPVARWVTVMAGERHLIGSPISLQLIGRIDGYAEAWEGGVRGWAWCPGEPDADPRLSIEAGGEIQDMVATEPVGGIAHLSPFARPRSIDIPWADLPARGPPIRLRGRDGQDLLGSPIVEFWPEQTGKMDRATSRAPTAWSPGSLAPSVPRSGTSRKSSPGAMPSQRGKPALIIMSGGARDIAGSCIEYVMTMVDTRVRIVLADRPGEGQIRNPRHGLERPIQFDGDIEAAIAAFPNHDVVLLESGTLVPPGWLELLSGAAYMAPDIGTVTPFSNRGAVAYPFPDGSDLSWFTNDAVRSSHAEAGLAPALSDRSTRETGRDTTMWLHRLTRRANRGKTVAIPSGGGPCVFIRGDCLAKVGAFRSGLFAQGIGAQEDFCARASAAGWRNLALPGLFVGYQGRGPLACPDGDDAKPTRSRAAWHQLHTRNMSLLARLHPDFRINADLSADLLGPARRRLDLERWRTDERAAAVLVTHADGGGVERRIEAEVASQQTNCRRAVVLRPKKRPDGAAGVAIDRDLFPNLRFELPREQPALLRLLRGAKPAEAQLHHFLNHDPSVFRIIRALGIPYDAHIHDYTWFCPRIALVGRGDRYCGEPEQATCETCVAELGSYLHEDIRVAALRDRSREFLFGARRVVAPSQDAADRMAKHFPGLPATVIPHENDDVVDEPPPISPVDGTVRVCVLGAIGLHKGFEVLLACGLDAARRGLDLTFVVVGTTIDDQRLMDTGRVFVTGPYQPREAVALVRAQGAALAFLPSIWPETWCLALTELWCAGLRVATFDIGAPAERIRRTGRGFLIPLALPAAAINDTLLERATGRSLLPVRESSAYKAPR